MMLCYITLKYHYVRNINTVYVSMEYVFGTNYLYMKGGFMNIVNLKMYKSRGFSVNENNINRVKPLQKDLEHFFFIFAIYCTYNYQLI